MFILLRTAEPQGGFIKRKRQRKAIVNTLPVSVPTENGMPFFMLDILNEKNGPDYSLIEEKSGYYASRIVAPRSLTLPDKAGIKRFLPGYSNGIFIFNTALKIITELDYRLTRVSITVIDRNAVMCGETARLIPFSSPLKIITSRPERYAAACQKIYDEYGASVMLRSFYEPTAKKDIVICCDGATSDSMNNAAVFSFKRGTYGKLRFFGSGITLSDYHKEIIPRNIDATDFAAAVTELCGSTSYKAAVYSDIETNCNKCGESNPTECLRCYISGSLGV